MNIDSSKAPDEKEMLPENKVIEFSIEEQTFKERWCNMSFLSNCISFCFLLLGIILTYSVGDDQGAKTFARYVLSFGLFAFAGGITNWLAVKMLFDQVIFLYGSGVIPRRFVEIRKGMKKVIMDSFFDEEHMRGFMKENFGNIDIPAEVWNDMIDSPKMSSMIDDRINEQLNNPLAMMMMAGLGIQNPTSLVPMVKVMLLSFAKGMVPEIESKLKEVLAQSTGDVKNLRGQIDHLLEDRLKYLTAEAVKKLMEDVIRRHLHWLVIWGNVFGGFIGLLTAIANWPRN